eukprot:g7861.t1
MEDNVPVLEKPTVQALLKRAGNLVKEGKIDEASGTLTKAWPLAKEGPEKEAIGSYLNLTRKLLEAEARSPNTVNIDYSVDTLKYERHPKFLVEELQKLSNPVIRAIENSHGLSPVYVNRKISKTCMGGLMTINVRSRASKVELKTVEVGPFADQVLKISSFKVGPSDISSYPQLKAKIQSTTDFGLKAGVFAGGLIVAINGVQVGGYPEPKVKDMIETAKKVKGRPIKMQLLRLPKCLEPLKPFHQHHCRSCKLIFCDSCASKKIVLPAAYNESGILFRKTRVCDFCFALNDGKRPENARDMMLLRRQMFKGKTEGHEDDYFCLELDESTCTISDIDNAYKRLTDIADKENNGTKIRELKKAFHNLTGEIKDEDGNVIGDGPFKVDYYYHVLGLKKKSPDEEQPLIEEREITKAYHKAALKHHPDKQAQKSIAEQEHAAAEYAKIEKAKKYFDEKDNDEEVEKDPESVKTSAYKMHYKKVTKTIEKNVGNHIKNCQLCGQSFLLVGGFSFGTRHNCHKCNTYVCNNCCERKGEQKKYNTSKQLITCTECLKIESKYGKRPSNLQNLLLIRFNVEPPKGLSYLKYLDLEPAVRVQWVDDSYNVTIRWNLVTEENSDPHPKQSEMTFLKFSAKRSFKDFEWFDKKIRKVPGLPIQCKMPRRASIFSNKADKKVEEMQNYASYILRSADDGCKQFCGTPFSKCDEGNAMRKACWLVRAFFGFTMEEFEIVRNKWSKTDKTGFNFHNKLQPLGLTMLKLDSFHKWCRFKIEESVFRKMVLTLESRKNAQDTRRSNLEKRVSKNAARRKTLKKLIKEAPERIERSKNRMENQPSRANREKNRMEMQESESVLVHINRKNDNMLRKDDAAVRESDKRMFSELKSIYQQYLSINKNVKKLVIPNERYAWELEMENVVFPDVAKYIFQYYTTLTVEKKEVNDGNNMSKYTYHKIDLSGDPNEPLYRLNENVNSIKIGLPKEEKRLEVEDKGLENELKMVNIESTMLTQVSQIIALEEIRWKNEDAKYALEESYIKSERQMRHEKEAIIEADLSKREKGLSMLKQSLDQRNLIESSIVNSTNNRFNNQKARKEEAERLAKEWQYQNSKPEARITRERKRLEMQQSCSMVLRFNDREADDEERKDYMHALQAIANNRDTCVVRHESENSIHLKEESTLERFADNCEDAKQYLEEGNPVTLQEGLAVITDSLAKRCEIPQNSVDHEFENGIKLRREEVNKFLIVLSNRISKESNNILASQNDLKIEEKNFSEESVVFEMQRQHLDTGKITQEEERELIDKEQELHKDKCSMYINSCIEATKIIRKRKEKLSKIISLSVNLEDRSNSLYSEAAYQKQLMDKNKRQCATVCRNVDKRIDICRENLNYQKNNYKRLFFPKRTNQANKSKEESMMNKFIGEYKVSVNKNTSCLSFVETTQSKLNSSYQDAESYYDICEQNSSKIENMWKEYGPEKTMHESLLSSHNLHDTLFVSHFREAVNDTNSMFLKARSQKRIVDTKLSSLQQALEALVKINTDLFQSNENCLSLMVEAQEKHKVEITLLQAEDSIRNKKENVISSQLKLAMRLESNMRSTVSKWKSHTNSVRQSIRNADISYSRSVLNKRSIDATSYNKNEIERRIHEYASSKSHCIDTLYALNNIDVIPSTLDHFQGTISQFENATNELLELVDGNNKSTEDLWLSAILDETRTLSSSVRSLEKRKFPEFKSTWREQINSIKNKNNELDNQKTILQNKISMHKSELNQAENLWQHSDYYVHGDKYSGIRRSSDDYLGNCATTGLSCKNCSRGVGCRWAGQGRPGHR